MKIKSGVRMCGTEQMEMLVLSLYLMSLMTQIRKPDAADIL